MAKERKKAKDREPAKSEAHEVEAPAAEIEVQAADSAPGFVRVRNMGARRWIGSDYPPGKVGSIGPGEVEEVTEQRAVELLKDYARGSSGVGPFEIVRD